MNPAASSAPTRRGGWQGAVERLTRASDQVENISNSLGERVGSTTPMLTVDSGRMDYIGQSCELRRPEPGRSERTSVKVCPSSSWILGRELARFAVNCKLSMLAIGDGVPLGLLRVVVAVACFEPPRARICS
jgi:hypothetical protein